MHVLLLRPVPENDRFGLGPFFRIEPLGLEYVAAALKRRGHRTTVADLRYSRSLDALLKATRPALVGIACMHALETDEVLSLAAEVRRKSPDAFVLVGGHTAAAYPSPFFTSDVDAVCVSDGELVVPDLADTIRASGDPASVPGLIVRDREGRFTRTPSPDRTFALDE